MASNNFSFTVCVCRDRVNFFLGMTGFRNSSQNKGLDLFLKYSKLLHRFDLILRCEHKNHRMLNADNKNLLDKLALVFSPSLF